MKDLIEQAAQIIDQYSPELGRTFRAQPFNRVNLACAFAAGFVVNPEDDAPEVANLVLRVAMLDRDARKLAQESKY